MPIQHPRLRSAGKMSYIHITEENIDKEHICCAMSGKQSLAKKEWLKQRFNEGLVFYRSEERGKCFIEYIRRKTHGCDRCGRVDLYQLSMGGRFFERSWTFR